MESNEFLKSEVESKLKVCVEALKEEFKAMQVGRANPAILNGIKIDYYGSLTPISQIVSISVVEARILQITPWDVNVLPLIEKAIQKANLGINPANDGKLIRLVFPQLTGERRNEIVKEIGSIQEKFKITIRNVRKKAIDDVKDMGKKGELSEDEEGELKEKIQKLIDEYVKQVAQISKIKEKEVLSI